VASRLDTNLGQVVIPHVETGGSAPVGSDRDGPTIDARARTWYGVAGHRTRGTHIWGQVERRSNDCGVTFGHFVGKGTEGAGYRGIKRHRARNGMGIVPEAVGACQRELASRETTLAAEGKVADVTY
jgi:hypothetical protein